MHNRSLYKKGVSLVTVLIFMMVATIAATATYKWLSSVGFTSADRMAIAEAKESSRAGLEAVRSWMTYHANDVGAVIRQYYDNGKKPVELNDVIHMESGKQRASVWLTAVEAREAKKYMYKFTIVSTGYSRADVKYTETSVLNVRGLYKIKVPIKFNHKTLNYDYSYFGGSTKGAQGTKNTSMVINGNWTGNPSGVDSSFIVTGNVELSGSNINLGKKSCVGGNFMPENDGVTVTDIFVNGNTTKFSGNVNGNAYFNGNFRRAETGDFHALKDFTVNGDFTTADARPVTIDGSLCMISSTGSLLIKNVDNLAPNGLLNEFKVNGGVKFLNTGNEVIQGSAPDGHPNAYKNLILGGAGYKVDVPASANCGGNAFCISSKETFVSDADAGSEVACDTSIVTYCKSALGDPVSSGCDGSQYKIKDVLTTAYDEFKKFSDTRHTPCSDTTISDSLFDVKTLNTCYTNASNNSQLFHGFLVVKINNNTTNIFTKPTGALKGKFIFYADEQITSDLNFPVMADSNSYAFVYLANGAKKINTTSDVGVRSYFFYSEHDIEVLQHGASAADDRRWYGSFYMTAENCARITDINTTDQYLEYNKTLVQILLDSAIICDISEKGSCGVTSGSGSVDYNPAGEDEVDGYDIHYVATSPQLTVSLESQHRDNQFKEPDVVTTVKPSIVVLPRVAYLNRKPKGRLIDYFSVINLNGAEEIQDADRTQCIDLLEGQRPDEAILPDPNSSLKPGVYNCTFQASAKYALSGNGGLYNFWVVIDGDLDDLSNVSFNDPSYVQVFAGSSVPTEVSLVVDGKQAEDVSVRIRLDKIPDNWNLTLGTDVQDLGTDADGYKVYKANVHASATTPVFFVTTESDAAKDQMNFSIEEVSDNAHVVSPFTKTLQITGDGYVKRQNIYSSLCGAETLIKGLTCDSIAKLPDCPEGAILKMGSANKVWVKPNCGSVYTIDQNNYWACSYEGEPLSLVEGDGTYELCDVFVHDSIIENPVDGQEYTLYASFKAKTRTITVDKTGAGSSDIIVRIADHEINEFNFEDPDVKKYVCSNTPCEYSVPAGFYMSFQGDEKNEEHLSEWIHTENGKETKDPSNPYDIIVGYDATIVGVFTKGEDHCFETTFEGTTIWCNAETRAAGNNDCIDMCPDITKKGACSTDGGGYQPTSYWLSPRTNDGKNYTEPGKESGSVFYDAGKNPNSGNSTITYILHRAQAGGHGMMTTNFKTCIDEGSNKNLNSGFVLRANSKIGPYYSIINILGKNDGTMFARSCRGDGTGIKTAQGNVKCKTADFEKFKFLPSSGIPQAGFYATIEVPKDQNKAYVTLSYGNISETVSLDLLVSANTGDAVAEDRGSFYVGISIADDCFKVAGLGWESYDWEGGCGESAEPKVTCSFASHYLGGFLPIGEEVTPWVGTSSWFNDPDNPYRLRSDCEISYHYNGCDVPGNYISNTGSISCNGNQETERNYSLTGTSAQTLRNKNYAFTVAGKHGEVIEDEGVEKKIRDASVVIDCQSAGGTNGKVYVKSCGAFNVGELTTCKQSLNFRVDCSEYTKECQVNVVGGYVNMRSSTLLGEIADLRTEPDADGNLPVVNAFLVDVNGRMSQLIQISGNGQFMRDVNLYSDMMNFDPEKVSAIRFLSEESFTLLNLRSECSNSFGVSECSAQFVNDHIVVSSKMHNVDDTKCKVVGNDNDFKTEEMDCPKNGAFTIDAENLQEEINVSGERNYTFTITMKSEKDENFVQTCITPPMQVSESGLWCHFADGIESVAAGELLPAIEFGISNCLTNRCEVTASVSGNGEKIEATPAFKKGESSAIWSPGTLTKAGAVYTYELEYMGATCSRSIGVASSDDGGTVSNCMISNDVFTANLNLTKTSTLVLSYTDALGNVSKDPLETKTVNSSVADYFYSGLSEIKGVTNSNVFVVLSVDGVGACSEPYIIKNGTEASTLPTDLGCSIDGEMFKTKVKNETGSPVDVSLQCSNGQPIVGPNPWGDEFLSINAFTSTHTDCPQYRLMQDGKVLCSVDNPAYEKPSTPGTPSATCLMDASEGEVGSIHKLTVSGFQNVPEASTVMVNDQSKPYNGSDLVFEISAKSSGSVSYSAVYDAQTLCGPVSFTWTEQQPTVTPSATACAVYDGSAKVTEGTVDKDYTFKVSGITGVDDLNNVLVKGMSGTVSGNDVTFKISPSGIGVATYNAEYKGTSLCGSDVSFTWKAAAPKPKIECSIEQIKGNNYKFNVSTNVENVTFDCKGSPANRISSKEAFDDYISFVKDKNNGKIICTASGKDLSCSKELSW